MYIVGMYCSGRRCFENTFLANGLTVLPSRWHNSIYVLVVSVGRCGNDHWSRFVAWNQRYTQIFRYVCRCVHILRLMRYFMWGIALLNCTEWYPLGQWLSESGSGLKLPPIVTCPSASMFWQEFLLGARTFAIVCCQLVQRDLIALKCYHWQFAGVWVNAVLNNHWYLMWFLSMTWQRHVGQIEWVRFAIDTKERNIPR